MQHRNYMQVIGGHCFICHQDYDGNPNLKNHPCIGSFVVTECTEKCSTKYTSQKVTKVSSTTPKWVEKMDSDIHHVTYKTKDGLNIFLSRDQVIEFIKFQQDRLVRVVELEKQAVEDACEKYCGAEQKIKSNGCVHLPVQQSLERILKVIKEI